MASAAGEEVSPILEVLQELGFRFRDDGHTDLFDAHITDTHTDIFSARLLDDSLYIDSSPFLARQTANGLSSFANFSSRTYDQYVLDLEESMTGCKLQGAVPVPLALNGTCELGWLCERELRDIRMMEGR